MERGPTIQSILRDSFESVNRSRRLVPHAVRVARLIMKCRTEALGGHRQYCPHGHWSRIWYNSCRNRSCPGCSFIDRARWLEGKTARLIDCPHHHVIFTIPEELNELWLSDTRQVATLLMDAVRETLVQLLLTDTQWLGAKPGIFAALHTWGQSLSLHPHVHALVTAGGLTKDEQWKLPVSQCLLPGKVIMLVFRGILLNRLELAIKSDELRLPRGWSSAEALSLLQRASCKSWNVRVLPRAPSGAHVTKYMAAYIKGGPIGNSRICAVQDGHVRFRIRDHRKTDEEGRPTRTVTTLPIDEFIRRFLLHVPPPRFHTVRSWGLYANAATHLLDIARILNQQAPYEMPDLMHWTEFCAFCGDMHPERCPICGAPLEQDGFFEPGRSPPPSPTSEGTPQP